MRPSMPLNRLENSQPGPLRPSSPPRPKGFKRLAALPELHPTLQAGSLAPLHHAPKQAGLIEHSLSMQATRLKTA